jgi:DNA-binding beta-propeller fold protein YncE
MNMQAITRRRGRAGGYAAAALGASAVVLVLGAFAPAAAQAVRVSAAGTAHAAVSPGTQLWAKLYNKNANSNSGHANAVAVSPNGTTVFVTGTNSTRTDYATIAYNTATGAQKWVKLYKSQGPGGCSFDNAVAVSPDGTTVFVTGECETATLRYDYTTVAYNAATGAQKWVKLYNGAGTLNYANALAVSPDGKTVFVTGESDAKNLTAQYGTVAYNAATGAQLWAERYSGPSGSSDIAHSVAVSPDGHTVFVTGVSNSSTSTDDATVAYNAASGAKLWAVRHRGHPIGNASNYNSLAVSPTGGAVYVTGITGDSNAPGAGYDTIAYSAATGAQMWAKHYATDAGGYSVAVSPDGSTVFVTGTAFRAHRGYGYATVAYDAATGAQLWAKIHLGTFGGLPTAQAYAVAVSPDGGTVYVTGLSAARTVYDYATVAYSAAAGAQQWAKLYRIPGNTSAYGQGPVAEAVSPTSGTVIVTGADIDGEWATVAYSG